MQETILGSRIRELRRQVGVTQADLARQIGISPSYLNLIERNKRRIAGTRLRHLAEALGLRPEDLDGSAERRLVDGLLGIVRRTSVDRSDLDPATIADLVGRFPSWARFIVSTVQREQASQQAMRTMSDRLTQDPFIGEVAHSMMSRAAAIRSASEILTDYDDISPTERARFDTIIAEEARGLAKVGESLSAFFERAAEDAPILTPAEEVDAYFSTHVGRFEALEDATLRAEDRDAIIDQMLAQETAPKTEAAIDRARRALRRYAEDAAAMPGPAFSARAADTRYDLDTLAAAFSVPVAAVCRRLTTLESAPGVPRFGYLAANAAGSLVEHMPLPGFAAPRFAHLCPIWILFRAMAQPGVSQRQIAAMPNGSRYVFVAHTAQVALDGMPAFGSAWMPVTHMLVVDASEAMSTVYAPAEPETGDPVGMSCRLCPRRACHHRSEDPFSPPD